MANDTHYPHAPITEAIIDLRVRFDGGIEISLLQRSCEEIRHDYPNDEELFEAIGQMQVKPGVGGSTSMRQNKIGSKRTNEERTQVVQFKRNGFTFSRLAPYDRWEPFRDEARRVWNVYRSKTDPDEITRLAVRYINRIDVPEESVDLKEYFRTSPEISPDLPQHVEQFFMQLKLPQPSISGSALVNQTIVPPPREGLTSVILDVDLFRDAKIPQQEEGIWTFFEELHRVKNEIFEACITDRTRRLFATCST